MNHFPVSSSQLSAPHLALFLQSQYNAAPGVECHLIKSGINDTYEVNTNLGKFVFRVYSLHWRTEEEISEEIRLIQLLKDHDMPVSSAVQDKHGRYLQTLHAPEGDRFGVLFTFAAGEKLPIYSPDIHFKIGTVMARMHQLTYQLPLNRVTYTATNLLEGSLPAIQRFLGTDTPEMAFMAAAEQYLLQTLRDADTSAIRKGVVHLDIWFDNMNINADGDITIFDFDFCGNGWQCMDIAYYILQQHNVFREMDECTLQTKAFLEGYNSVTPISAEEQRLLPVLGVALYFFYLRIQCDRYDNWSNVFLNEPYLKRFIKLLVKRYYDLYLPLSTVNPE
ncbi:MAG: phosphotransferase [Chitinophaga sp.]|uniref:phosphotransferase enzyme family protein n=1 Tax=Chitinophaga sp. TaxID=1869181 RepID=UPI001B068F69|nr:phosphotransferase [Chitinophaga sp.]MBO9731301.1 phosphotransferase [Chitinophaga sp.]